MPIVPPSPQLRDGDIVLRPWRVADIRAFHAACQDDEIPRWTGFPFGLTREAAGKLIDERIASFQSGTSAAFAVVDAPTNRLLGSVSLLWVDWERSVAQGAYWLRRDERGKGVATRALRLLTNWALNDLRLARVELTADVRKRHHIVDDYAAQRSAPRARLEPPSVLTPRCLCVIGTVEQPLALAAAVTSDSSRSFGAVTCPVTAAPDGKRLRALTGFPSHWWYGGDGIWGGLAPGYKPVGTWWARPRGNKVLWVPEVTGRLKLSGHRRDRPEQRIQVQVPAGYGLTGIQASRVILPAPRCWKISATVGGHRTSFTVRAVEP